MTGERRCDDCGRSRVEVNRDDASGILLCLRCLLRRPGGIRMAPRSDHAPRGRSVSQPPKRKPDWVALILTRLEDAGLPIEGGRPNVVGSLCPLCRAAMTVTFLDRGARLYCAAGCPEQQLDAWLVGGERAPSPPWHEDESYTPFADAIDGLLERRGVHPLRRRPTA